MEPFQSVTDCNGAVLPSGCAPTIGHMRRTASLLFLALEQRGSARWWWQILKDILGSKNIWG